MFAPKGVLFILVENQLIKLRVNATSLQHYLDLGYFVKVNETISVKAEDLTITCKKEVNVICDYCGKLFFKNNDKLHRGRKIIKKDACFSCFPLKQKEVINEKYDVDSTFQLPEVKEKSQTTLKEKYGVNNCMKSEEVKDKFKRTMIKKYGVEYAQQSKEIRNKSKQTLINNFGVDHQMKCSDIRKKVANTLFVNGVRVSNNQFKLAKILDGSINTVICGYFADIVLENKKIIIEYNGSGHRLSVKLGKISKEEFKNKEINKIFKFNENGWKCLIIENKNEKYINKKHIVDIINIINNMHKNIITYNIE